MWKSTWLPFPGESITHVYDAYVMGFGRVQSNYVDLPCELREARIDVFTIEECTTFTRIPKEVTDLMLEKGNAFCAGRLDGSADTCLGDSGGSLLIKKQETYVLEGIRQ